MAAMGSLNVLLGLWVLFSSQDPARLAPGVVLIGLGLICFSILSKVLLLALVWRQVFALANRIPLIPVGTALACLFFAAFLFVATVAQMDVGTTVDLHFTLPGGKRLDVKGIVRWTREVNDKTPDIFPGVGVQFAELTPDAAQAIHRFVSEREPMFYPD